MSFPVDPHSTGRLYARGGVYIGSEGALGMDNDSPESWHFTEGGVYVGGGSRGASRHEDGAVDQEGQENQHVGFFQHSSELHNMGVASPLTGDGGKENEVISVLHNCPSCPGVSN